MINLNNVKSLHFIPAVRLDFFEHFKINQLDADVIVFDLEDSVDENSKILAQENLIKIFLDNKDYLEKYKTCIRPNSKYTKYFKDDSKIINKINPDIVILPKVDNVEDLKFYKKTFKAKNIICAIETLAGVENVNEICQRLDPKTDAIVVGYEDLSSELKIERPPYLNSQNPLTQIIFSVFVVARRFNIQIFDAVCRFFKSEDIFILEKECEFTSSLRFSAKFSIHPNQISIINDYFSKEKINNYAEKIIDEFSNKSDGTGVRVVNNQIIDLPSLRLYKNIKNQNISLNNSEGKNLSDSYNWFKDDKVVKEFESALIEVVNFLPDNINMLGIGSGQGIVERTFMNIIEKEYNKKVSLIESDRDKNVFSKLEKDIGQVVVDNKKLPFENNKFDLVVSRSVTHYEPTKELEISVFREIKRVLKDDGIFLNETPYLSTPKEIELLYRIHNEFIGKPMNLKLKEGVIEIHQSVFSKVNLAVAQPSISLVVNKEAFKKRYDVDEETLKKIFDLIKEYNPNDIPNIYVKENNFGWTVPYMVIICRK